MSAYILTIGNHHFVIPSATIAVAIKEVLQDSIRLTPVAEQNGRLAWKTSCDSNPALSIHPIIDGIGQIGSMQLATSPLAEAVLGEPRRSRIRTHNLLIEAGRAA